MNYRCILTIILSISLFLGCYRSSAQTAEELLPKAIQLEEVKGELEEAIEIYQNNNLRRTLDLSSDGKRLVFGIANSDDSTWSILIMPVSGGEPRELCKFQESEGSERIKVITWTPDGKYVLFTEDNKKVSVLWRISPEGGESQKL